MAVKPTPDGSSGTWGTDLNAYLDVSIDTDGKIKNEALQTASTAPAADAALANKKYVDDQRQCKAWGRVNSGGVLQGSGLNVTTAKTDTGDYTMTWGTDFAGITYAVTIGLGNNGVTGATYNLHDFATGSCKITIIRADTGAEIDTPFSFAAFGTQ